MSKRPLIKLFLISLLSGCLPSLYDGDQQILEKSKLISPEWIEFKLGEVHAFEGDYVLVVKKSGVVDLKLGLAQIEKSAVEQARVELIKKRIDFTGSRAPKAATSQIQRLDQVMGNKIAISDLYYEKLTIKGQVVYQIFALVRVGDLGLNAW